MRTIAWTALIAAIVAGTGPARADRRDMPLAEVLFRDGRRASERGDYAAAHAKFVESQRIDPAPGTLLNLADCEEHLGQLVIASQHYRQAIEALADGDNRLAPARLRMTALEKRIPRLKIVVAPAALAGAKVSLDGADLERERMGAPLPVNPGDHAIDVSVDGQRQRRFSVNMAEGQSQELTVEPAARNDAAPGPDPAPVVPPAPGAPGQVSTMQGPEHEPVRTQRAVGYAATGIGAASLMAGAVAGVMAIDKKSTMASHCDPTGGCDQAGVDAASAGKTLATVSTTTFLLGALSVGTGLYLVLSDDRKRTPKTVVTPMALPTAIGLAWHGSFE